MPVFNNILTGAAGAGGAADFEIKRSLRFNSGDSAYLSRTPSSPGNRRTWTWSGWIKKTVNNSSGRYFIFNADTSSQNSTIEYKNDAISVFDYHSAAYQWQLVTEAVFRDNSSWFHLVVSVDTTQATASNRVKIYINGVQQTSFSTTNYPSLSYESKFNAALEHRVGALNNNTFFLDSYLAEIHFVDGQQLAPTDFGEEDSNGVWQPKRVNITGPNNGTTWSNGGNDSDLAAGSWANVFNGASSGDHGTFSTVASEQGSGNSATITFNPAISGVIDVVMSAAASAGSIDGGVALSDGTSIGVTTHSGSPKLESFGSKTNITSLTLNAGTNGGCSISEIRLDGVPLIDGDSTNIGVNGFHLDFSDNSSNAALGTDSSANTNTWTVNNITASAAGVPITSIKFDVQSNSGGQMRVFYIGSTAVTSSVYATATNNISQYDSGMGSGDFPSAHDGNEATSLDWKYGDITYTFTNKSAAYVEFIGNMTNGTVQVNGTTYTPVASGTSSGNRTIYRITLANPANVDSLLDSPTNYDDGTNVGGNYCSFNPLDANSQATLSNGNLDWDVPSGGNGTCRGTIAVSSGKWYWEYTFNSGGGTAFGILDVTESRDFPGWTNAPKGYSYYSEGSNFTKKYYNGTNADYGASFGPGDVIGVALDMDGGTINFYKNGVDQGQAYSGISGTFAPVVSYGSSIGSSSVSLNTGQRPFDISSVPTGYKALCTQNLEDPLIANGSDYFDVITRNGLGSSGGNITGLSFSPDLVWEKARNTTSDHYLMDTVRGATKDLRSNQTNAENTNANYLTAFNSDGYTVGSADWSTSTTVVSWAWDAGTTTVSNTDGSGLTNVNVRANQSAGFSIVSYTGSSGTGSFGHGLSAAPEFVVIKNREESQNWTIYHKGLTLGDYLKLTDAPAIDYPMFNDAHPSSSIVQVGNDDQVSKNGIDYIAYCWTPVSQYSSFGVFLGTGTADGPFVYTGFRPRFLLLKNTDVASGGWIIFDTERDAYNVMDARLFANTSTQEGNSTTNPNIVDALSNGFKVRYSGNNFNGSGDSIIYAAFAENPLKYARAR